MWLWIRLHSIFYFLFFFLHFDGLFFACVMMLINFTEMLKLNCLDFNQSTHRWYRSHLHKQQNILRTEKINYFFLYKVVKKAAWLLLSPNNCASLFFFIHFVFSPHHRRCRCCCCRRIFISKFLVSRSI